MPPAVEAFARRLMAGVLVHRHRLNTLIAQHAPEWPLDQMAVVDRNILRIAIFELGDADMDTPAKVAINEAVEMAKVFGSDSSPRFVNGVLGALLAATPQPSLGDDLAAGGLWRPDACGCDSRGRRSMNVSGHRQRRAVADPADCAVGDGAGAPAAVDPPVGQGRARCCPSSPAPGSSSTPNSIGN